MAKESTIRREITNQEQKMLTLFRRIPSKTERRAFIVLAEAIALGRLAK